MFQNSLNMKLQLQFPLSITFWAIPFLFFAQSGWVRQPGDYYFKVSYSTFSSQNYFDTLGLRVPGVQQFSQQNIFLYGEYGLAKSFALTLNWAPWRANRYSNTSWVTGISDPMLEIKYALPLPFAVSLGLAAEFPLGNANLSTQDDALPPNTIILPTGDGEWNYLATLAFSHSLAPEPAYVQGFVQYNYRTNYQGLDFQNQFRYGLEIGYRFGERLWVNAALRGQGLSGRRSGPVGDFTRGDGTTYDQLHIGFSWNFWHSLNLTLDIENYASWFEDQRNLYSGSVFLLGLAFTPKLD